MNKEEEFRRQLLLAAAKCAGDGWILIVLDADDDCPWDKWMLFLHPAQRQWVERDYAGPARIAGSAGTGKTIVALHRAVFLARSNPEARVLARSLSNGRSISSGHPMEVPFTPGRTDATQAQTDVESLAVLEPRPTVSATPSGSPTPCLPRKCWWTPSSTLQ
ncbi:hypothetical protein [Aromatoleum anaerobium]|uniref:hypothetical protein n=1 Tax=Aromatoleum anaerobium TaxID=182180 RepID=UPI001B7CF1B0|nr:hypothetical protein [Aromatoleum anaerobium]MCK0507759.1 hypothetical protein [Aromatoleum anaerobium]